MNENESGTPFEDFLRSILGDEAAAEAARALEAQASIRRTCLPEFSDPARMQAALGQFQFLMNTTAGPVNWRVVEDSAKQAAYMSGDQAPTATEAEAARQAMTIADLWLDAVTDFASGPVTRDVWSKVAWVEHTIPTWKRICEPIALNVSRAVGGALRSVRSRRPRRGLVPARWDGGDAGQDAGDDAPPVGDDVLRAARTRPWAPWPGRVVWPPTTRASPCRTPRTLPCCPTTSRSSPTAWTHPR